MELLQMYLTNFFEWIVTTSVRASILVVFILLAKRVLGNQFRPRWHYLLWILVIIRLSLPWSMESSFSFFNLLNYGDKSIHLESHLIQKKMSTDSAQQGTNLIEKNKMRQQPVKKSALSVEPITPDINSFKPGKNYLYSILSILWFGIALFYVVCSFWVNRKFINQIKRTAVPVQKEIVGLFDQCRMRMRILRHIPILECREVKSPMLVGYFCPRVVLPIGLLKTLTQDQLRYIFLHELAHVKRSDLGINWIMHCLLTLHWFNPILWYAYRKMREDQEVACDALAMTYIDPKETKSYGRTMISLLELFSNRIHFPGTAGFAGSKKQLKRRITMIQRFKRNSYRWSILGLGLFVILSGVFLTNAPNKLMASSNKDVIKESAKELNKNVTVEVNKEKKESKQEQLIDNLYRTASNGKILVTNFQIGTTKMKTVLTQWSKPHIQEEDYLVYNGKGFELSFEKGVLVTVSRSDKSFTLKDVLKVVKQNPIERGGGLKHGSLTYSGKHGNIVFEHYTNTCYFTVGKGAYIQ